MNCPGIGVRVYVASGVTNNRKEIADLATAAKDQHASAWSQDLSLPVARFDDRPHPPT
jgi:hypothetical protein